MTTGVGRTFLSDAPGFDSGFDFGLDLGSGCSSLDIKGKTNVKIKTNFKGVGQEYPTHTRARALLKT